MRLAFVIGATLVVTLISTLVSTISRIYRHAQTARQIGLPTLYSPVSTRNPLWALFREPLTDLLRFLPKFLRNWTEYSYFGFVYRMKRELHDTHGSCFQIVSPGGVAIYVADPDVARELVMRNEAFPKPLEELAVLNIFGTNLATTEGLTWKKHRRITAAVFNERNSELVWNESLRQGHEMVERLAEDGGNENRKPGSNIRVSNILVHTMTLALNVFTSAGFGLSSSFHDVTKEGGKTDRTSPLNTSAALRTILDNIGPVVAVPQWILRSIFAPAIWNQCASAIDQWRTFSTRLSHDDGISLDARRNTLLANLQRSAQAESKINNVESSQIPAPSSKLSQEEISGNIFVFSMAGSETSAVTLAAALTQLALYPDIQMWTFEEILKLKEPARLESADYHLTYPRLFRIRAVIFETLRLLGPTPQFAKSTNNGAQSLMTPAGLLQIPSGVQIHVNNVALHLDEGIWGSNAQDFEPKRWTDLDQDGNDQLRPNYPPKGAFMPWAGGARVCPGQKFSLVEMSAVLLAVLARWKISLARMNVKETQVEAQRRVMKEVEERKFRITLQPKACSDLEFTRRLS